MAFVRKEIDGHGQVELNNAAFRRDGRIEAQCALDPDIFSVDTPAENGMLLSVNKAKRLITVSDGSFPIALHYSSEHIYDERTPGLKNFKLVPGAFLPRVGYLAIGDSFTTNCVGYDTDEFADEDALDDALEDYDTVPVYGGISETGAILVTADEPTTGPVLQVVEVTTMPDGQFGLKFHVLKV